MRTHALLTLALASLAASTAYAEKSGFHLTVLTGAAQHTTTSSIDGVSDDVRISGFGIGGMLAAGWTLAPGFVLGVGGGGGHIFSPTVEVGGTEADAENDLIFFTSGLYADYSFDPAGRGWHVHALLGLGTTEEGDDDIPDVAIGFGGLLGGGYRVPINADWAFDAVGRLQVLATSAETKGGASVSNLSLAPALLVGVTWH